MDIDQNPFVETILIITHNIVFGRELVDFMPILFITWSSKARGKKLDSYYYEVKNRFSGKDESFPENRKCFAMSEIVHVR